MNKKITQDGTKYSKLLSVLTLEARSRMVGHLPEPGTHNDDYQPLKEKLKEAYTKTKMERCAEMMSISSLVDMNPEHLLSYMRGLLPGEEFGDLFQYIWLSALPDSVHEVLSADDSELDVLAARATRIIKEKAARKKKVSQINAIKAPELEEEVNAVTKRKETGSKTGTICANHLRFPGKCYRCFDPDNCVLKDWTDDDRYPLPHIQDFGSNLHGNKVFSVLDLQRGYHQIPMDPAERWLRGLALTTLSTSSEVPGFDTRHLQTAFVRNPCSTQH